MSVIVKLNGQSLLSYAGGVPGLAPTAARAGAGRPDVASLASRAYRKYLLKRHGDFEARARRAVPQTRITYHYDIILNAVALRVPVALVHLLAKLPEVEAVYPDERLQLTTDNSPQFIGAPAAWKKLGGQEDAGEDVIVGVLDSGVWPEHPSFSDPDPSGKPYAPLASWHGTSCQFGSDVPGDVPFSCNNKLIGAVRIMDSYDHERSLSAGEFPSARDDAGHGTHTASTAAGNAEVAASIFGIPRGTLSGIAPRARVAIYKVCGSYCSSSDAAAGIQQAIADGVNVINFSIGGGKRPYQDAVSLALLDAYNAGIFVAASAGNDGPTANTVEHREPWVTTVAASSENRAFVNTANVTADGGDALTLAGASLTAGINTPKRLAVPTSDPYCINPFKRREFSDRIVVCKRGGDVTRVEKGYNVLQGGAVGMILYNQAANQTDLEADNHFLPSIHIQYTDGQALLSFLATHQDVRVSLTQPAEEPSQGDVIASFSSRGGPGQRLGINKPDVAAPGVQILAGHTPLSVDISSGPQDELFQAMAGTSMSSPHVTGAGALLKAIYPSWTPSQIRSALMLTAKTSLVFKPNGNTLANAFDYGSGRINLRQAHAAGLTFDAPGSEFIAHKNDLWNVNYPSLYVPQMPSLLTVQRTVHNEKPSGVSWRVQVKAPKDLKVIVPDQIFIEGNGNATFDITVDGSNVPTNGTRHASLLFTSDSQGTLHFPITVVRK